MSRHLRQVADTALDEPKAELARRDHRAAIVELQTLPASSLRVIKDVVLANGVPTPVAHKLGRSPSFVTVSCVRGAVAAGYVVETRGGAISRDQVVMLTANSYGATITVDVLAL